MIVLCGLDDRVRVPAVMVVLRLFCVALVVWLVGCGLLVGFVLVVGVFDAGL